MFRRLFSRRPPQPDVTAWWRAANALAVAPTADGLAALRASALPMTEAPDLAEDQQEMLEGLETLLQVSAAASLPVVDTQHRVIGADRCHHLAPASLVDQVDAGGKLFVTSARLVLVAGSVQAWPWHLVSGLSRQDRDVIVDLRGRAPVRLRLNTYEGALIVCALAERLRTNRP